MKSHVPTAHHGTNAAHFTSVRWGLLLIGACQWTWALPYGPVRKSGNSLFRLIVGPNALDTHPKGSKSLNWSEDHPGSNLYQEDSVPPYSAQLGPGRKAHRIWPGFGPEIK